MEKKKNILKRILCLFAFAFMAFNATSFSKPKTIYAEQPQHNHDGWEQIDILPQNSGNYVLNSDITLSSTWNVPTGETNLCLNGHVINANGGNFNIIVINSGSTLNLYDCGTTTNIGYVDNDGLWKLGIGEGTEKAITGGVITGAKTSGVKVGGTFNMYGGTICGCSSIDGAGVLVNAGGTFNMNNGTISHNNAVNCGAGINVQGTFNMQNGVIEFNNAKPDTTSTYFGGGGLVFYGNGKGTLSGGQIRYNSSTVKGGGILLLQTGSSQSQTVSLVGVSISNNTAAAAGGGVFFDNSAVTIMLGGNTNISNNVINGTITKTDNGYSLTGGDKNNFDLGRGTKIQIAEESYSPNGMNVGIYNSGTRINNATEGDDKYFFSDRGNYKVEYNTEKYIELKSITINDILPEYLLADSNNKAENENGYSVAYVYNGKLFFQEKTNYSSVINDLSITTALNINGDNYVVTHNGRTITFIMGSNGLQSITVSSTLNDRLDGTYIISHIHSFDYEANDNVITAKCLDGCTEGWDEEPLTLTLTAPTSLTYDGEAKRFNFLDGEADAWEAAGLETPTIAYYIKQSGQSDYSILFGSPREVDDYMAQITVGGEVAQVEFAIGKATPYIANIPASSDINLGSKLSDSTLFGGSVQISSTNGNQVAGLFEWKEPDTIPTLADSEVTLYDVTFTPVDEKNFNSVTCQVMVRVNHSHNPIKVDGQDPTDTAYGWSDYYECSCGNFYEDQNGTTLIEDLDAWKAYGAGYIAPLGHDMTHHAAVAPTCTTDGNVEYWTCSRESGVYYANAEGTSTLTSVVDPKLGHNLVHHDANAAICTEKGWEAYDTCSRCNYSTYTEIPALNHHYSGEVTYTWNADQCTATIHCDHEGCSVVDTMTVTGTYVKDTDATRKNNELGHYEATFNNPNFVKQVTEANSVEKENTKLPGLSTGALVGIIIGLVVLACLIAYISMFFVWKKNNKALKFLIPSFEWINKRFSK